MPQNEDRKKVPKDFYFLKIVGEGSFSTVYLALEAESKKEYAIKVLKKRQIIRENKMEYVNREKKSLLKLGGSKYFVHLYATFQDSEHLYFVLSYARNGELLNHLIRHKSFCLEWVEFYAAELLLALEYMKSKHIIHRDLKPENILFDRNWHILVTDFGSSKIIGEDDTVQQPNDSNNCRRRKNSFVGTAQYVSPEVLHGEKPSYSADLWAFGCIIYQMIVGQTPFRAGSEYLIFQKITNLDYEFPEGFDETARDLVEKLIVIVPENRLGANDSTSYSSIREHSFFKNTNWDDLGPAPALSDGCDKDKDNFVIPNGLEPGLSDEILAQLHLNMLSFPSEPEVVMHEPPVRKKSEPKRRLTDLTQEEIEERLKLQKDDEYSSFVDGNLILKRGILEKKKGTFGFARKRMFLLTFGPHLYYVDPSTMTLKGEVPFSEDMKTEAKNFKVFYVHTPNRIYYLEDPTGYALEWCKAIDEVVTHYFPKKN
ncbi:3-phosphoinositide-dependent protein kinase 1 [Coccinella septempunctata]|uniref:3-phosphoinositide-dependent protein kinase 1 n=1 Tax=Coccinella septempunctata TaxID=41139 RepID=UPI001D070D35|nr:3-phosphoinositide-dependent protein kinase 1 [Coccinella septempunctata]XP_044764562.1 3-phosphoinositide-dependent protein kinase 1 [Coccinella septempunctata]